MRWAMSICAAFGLLASGPWPARAEDRTIIPPPGDYRMVTLVLVNGGPMFQPMWGNSLARREGDLIVRSAFRDGRIRIPGRLSVRQIVSELRLDAGAIRTATICERASHATELISAAQGTFTGTARTP